MIFLTCLTVNFRRETKYDFDDALLQYKFLLKSIAKFHPDAFPVLFIMDEYWSKIDYEKILNEMGGIHKNLIIIADELYKGLFDSTRFRIARYFLMEFKQPIILIDADCMLCKSLNEFLVPVEYATTFTTRGKMGNGEHINIGVTIFHNFMAIKLINMVTDKVKKNNKIDKSWNEVQPVMPEFFIQVNPKIFDEYKKDDINHAQSIIHPEGFALRLVDAKLLNCTTEKDFENAYIIHYKNQKGHSEELYNKYVLKIKEDE